MSKSEMCHVRTDVPRDFTNYMNSKISHKMLMRKLGFTSIHQLNDYIEQNGFDITKERNREIEDRYVCRSNGKNTFIDSTDFHKRFIEMHKGIRTQKLQPISGKQELMPHMDYPNYSSKYVTGSF